MVENVLTIRLTEISMSQMTPREIVHELDKHIIGQDNAKKSVAIALRNRWRRMQVAEELARSRSKVLPVPA